MTTNRLTGEEKLLIEVREQFKLVGCSFHLGLNLFPFGFLLSGFASEVFKPVDNFLTGNAFEGSVDSITVFNGGSADSDPDLGGFRRLISDGGNLGVRAATTRQIVFGIGGLAVDGVHFYITGLDVEPFFTQVEDAGRKAGDVEFGERIKGSDFSVFLDVLQDSVLLVVSVFSTHGYFPFLSNSISLSVASIASITEKSQIANSKAFSSRILNEPSR